MRSLFMEIVLDAAATEGLGIASNCLNLVRQHIDEVISRHGQELREAATFARAYGDFQEFVARMIADARLKGYPELHEDTFLQARAQCGLIFWCE